MRLSEALHLESISRLALVGAGGKTTALFQIARDLLMPVGTAQTVLVSVTTHLALEQIDLADHSFIVRNPDQVDKIGADLPSGVLLFTGVAQEQDRLGGLYGAVLDRLRDLADRIQAPLLVEADGARRLPLKAPASHEPLVPDWSEQVVVVAGLRGLNRTLDQSWVHRPEAFARLCGLKLGDTISLQALERVLTHPKGGLKDIPPAARRIALLNQADTPLLTSSGGQLAQNLLGHYQAVLVAALSPPGNSGDRIFSGVHAVFEPAAGVVLAAGGASRLGKPKQLLLWKNEPLVRHAVKSALEGGLSPVIVVSGAYGDEVSKAVVDLPVQLVQNPDWLDGQSTSMRAGLAALPPETGAVVFLLADQPQVPAVMVRELVAYHRRTLAPVIAPMVDGQRSNPVLFDRQVFPILSKVVGDVGGRAVFSQFPTAWLPWHDSSLLLDVDRPEDYQALLEMPAE